MKQGRLGLAAILALAFFSASAQAKPMSQSEAHGYKMYLKHHPPQEKPVKYNLYPFKGPIIQDGQDIPVCAAAKTPAAYAKKTDLRIVSHGKQGWLFRTADFRTDFSASPRTMEYFIRLNRALAARGQTLVMLFLPTRALMSAKFIDPADQPKDFTPEKAFQGYKAFVRQLHNAGLIVADLSRAPADPPYFPSGDVHWTVEGAAYSAMKVADVLQKIPAYRSIKKMDFKSEASGMGPANRGAFEEFIQQTCQVNIELTTEPLWKTTPTGDSAAEANSQPGKGSFPAITVLGTSNSAEDSRYNFVGALKYYSHADIYNAAITGGGFGSSAYRYYASDEYRRHPPKILVWEFLPQHNYNSNESMNAFRQMIPAVYGACDEKRSLAHYSGQITRGQIDLFPQVQSKSLKDSYLYIEASNPVERSLRVEILYKNGEADQVDLTRSVRAKNNGRYFFELGNEKGHDALFIRALTDKPQGRLTARICQYPVHMAEK